MIIIVPLAVLIAVSYLFRDDLGLRALLTYFALWITGLIVVLVLGLSPGVFTAIQCALAIAMLIHIRANPQI